MLTHIVKSDPRQFSLSLAGIKRFEIRQFDRPYAKGDTLVLKETKHSALEMQGGLDLEFTGREQRHEITDITVGYGLHDGFCVLSLEESS